MIVHQQSAAQQKVGDIYEALGRRLGATPFGTCPVELTAAFVRLCLAQSCGKCVPCRIGLDRLAALLDKILDGKGTEEDLQNIEPTAMAIYDSADCAVGFEAAKLVLDGLGAFLDDYRSHVEQGVCTESFGSVPCVTGCPAHVDIPGYVALIQDGRCADAVRLIRKDNPFPGVCALICEHPCERHCRRNLVDAPINIRALKRFAMENSGDVPAPLCAPINGKTVAVIGGGPAGLTAAYYLTLKGFQVTVYEKRRRLGGMLRYGVPCYRLPDDVLDKDIDVILSTGVKTVMSANIGTDVTLEELREKFDVVYISIGAHKDNKLHVPGEDAEGVLSAVQLLGAVGEGLAPDFTGKRVVVVGGGNVAMDATRTAMRLGASSVKCVYRRRIADMTALPDEIEGAMAEGCEIIQLMAPAGIRTEDDKVTGFTFQPQICGPVENGRPKPLDADKPAVTIDCDIVVVAAGQAIDSDYFAHRGIPVNRGRLGATAGAAVKNMPGVFAGGECVSGPATVIRAVDAGKVAANNIEASFGWHVDIVSGVEIPTASYLFKPAWGRVNPTERYAEERKNDFCLMENSMSAEEAKQECSRCLRCDHYGYGAFRDGRNTKW